MDCIIEDPEEKGRMVEPSIRDWHQARYTPFQQAAPRVDARFEITLSHSSRVEAGVVTKVLADSLTAGKQTDT